MDDDRLASDPHVIQLSALLTAPVVAAFLTGACTDASAGPSLPPPSGDESPPGPDVPGVEEFAVQSPASARTYVGSLEAKDRIEVAAAVGGTLAEVRFDVGDTVTKGDTIFRLTGKPTKLGLSRARQGLAAATHQVDTAAKHLARVEELRQAGAATAAALEQAQSAFDGASIQAQDAKVAVSMSKVGVSDLVTRTPMSGIVTQRNKSAGETVTSMPPTVVMIIENHEVLELDFRVPELVLRQFQPGTRVNVKIPALDLTRTVSVSRTGATVDPRTRTIEITCEVDNADLSLKPGMSVEITSI